MSHFNTFPNPPKLDVKPFTVAIPDADVVELKSLLKASRLGPSTPYNENPSDHSSGVSLDWLRTAKQAWETTFDWRAQEKRQNSLPHFMTRIPIQIQGKEYIHDIHFMALFSKKKDAAPLILLHGWPGSFIEFIPILEILSKKYTPETLPYHVVVPSLPGYAFSSGPQSTEFKQMDVANIFNDLMVGLGFDKYIAQGGDVGSGVARLLTYHDNCTAIHLNMLSPASPQDDDRSILSQAECKVLDRSKVFYQTGWAYGLEQGTRPNTLGFALSSSPLAILAWIGEKMLEWSDQDPSMDEILTNVSIYWFTNSISTSFYSYREAIVRKQGYYKYHEKPIGYTCFPCEIIPVPKSWVEKDGNLVFYRQAKSGGHFAALEVPELLLKDVEDFVEQVWGSSTNGVSHTNGVAH
ncbi:Alpha/Beta hydrolase protein [Mycena pura]|uniref:Alpha/Beta hydrolase protein n=1 Tax=Mycena pura TaxID=153505 RepID=A0AAD6VQ10_9AGAR|nr:Alpha/Beta hydrolase protein [Mycena pura]